MWYNHITPMWYNHITLVWYNHTTITAQARPQRPRPHHTYVVQPHHTKGTATSHSPPTAAVTAPPSASGTRRTCGPDPGGSWQGVGLRVHSGTRPRRRTQGAWFRVQGPWLHACMVGPRVQVGFRVQGPMAQGAMHGCTSEFAVVKVKGVKVQGGD